jgi:hypothetical protein
MKKLSIGLILLSVILGPFSSGLEVKANEDIDFNPHYLVSDTEMLDEDSMSLTDVQQFLERGYLAGFEDEDLDGVVRSAAEIIWNASQSYGISSEFLLVLLQREQSLVEDDSPTQNQLDWAMGYAVCDDCSKDDPRIQKFKGFANQVHYAAARIRESYLTDLMSRGYTETGVGPGIEIEIDGTLVVPVNYATSSLYTYTPHLHGNENFVQIWSDWFVRTFLNGSLLQDTTTGGIWLIQHGYRRPITSQAAFYSRFNANLVIPTSTTEIEKYPQGDPISFPNYSLLRSPTGAVYLIVDDERRGFASQEAFRAIGYSPDEIVDVTWDDLLVYEEGEPITADSIYPQGTLLQSKTTGGVVYAENGVRFPIYSREILQNRFGDLTIVQVEDVDFDSYVAGEAIKFVDGSLVAVVGSPDVFVISDGNRHHIADEETFTTYGWSFDQVVWTNERSVLLHPLEGVVSNSSESSEIQLTAY